MIAPSIAFAVPDHGTASIVYTEYAYGPIHRNSAEDFNARFRRTVAGIFRHRHSGLQTYRNGGAGHRLAASRAGAQYGHTACSLISHCGMSWTGHGHLSVVFG
jgi:hypothetical protein